MELKNLLINTRTHRSFSQEKISNEDIYKIIEATRYGGSARNAQRLRYGVVTDETLTLEIFKNTMMAGAITWKPTIEERPTAYILICTEKEIKADSGLYVDIGIASQNMMLTASSFNYGGCLIGAFNKNIEKILNIDEKFTLHYILALGKPTDTSSIVDGEKENLKYYREGYSHFVPKLKIEDLLIFTI